MRITTANWLSLTAILALASRTAAEASQAQLLSAPQYSFGQAIPVECLNRSIDTGEHMTDSKGQLQYVPFITCNETGRPLEFSFGVEKGTRITSSAPGPRER